MEARQILTSQSCSSGQATATWTGRARAATPCPRHRQTSHSAAVPAVAAAARRRRAPAASSAAGSCSPCWTPSSSGGGGGQRGGGGLGGGSAGANGAASHQQAPPPGPPPDGGEDKARPWPSSPPLRGTATWLMVPLSCRVLSCMQCTSGALCSLDPETLPGFHFIDRAPTSSPRVQSKPSAGRGRGKGHAPTICNAAWLT